MGPKKTRDLGIHRSRRDFLTSAAAFSMLPIFPYQLSTFLPHAMKQGQEHIANSLNEGKSIIGAYGPWASQLPENPRALSFRNAIHSDISTWRAQAMAKTQELLAAPKSTGAADVTLTSTYEYDGLTIEELTWQLSYGRPTEAILVKPAKAKGPLPAILALHDHSGMKYFGKRKNVKTSDQQHPMMVEHQKNYYSGRAWVNELAKRGYVVLIHDVFTFGSRMVMYEDLSGIDRESLMPTENSAMHPEAIEAITRYNEWSSNHEHIMSKSLFCAGTTWPGVTLSEDMAALDILCARPDVDKDNIGCCGLSGGGLRTDYLGGLDHRVKCAISVGFMSTWNDFLLNKSYTHTWMTYTPLLPNYLDFPEILGLRAPLPTMVLNNNEDRLYTLPEMKKADTILREVFEKAGAADKYSSKFYSGDHKFDTEMQEDAFDWFDTWLKS